MTWKLERCLRISACNPVSRPHNARRVWLLPEQSSLQAKVLRGLEPPAGRYAVTICPLQSSGQGVAGVQGGGPLQV